MFNRYATKDKKYTIAAVTKTIKRFGPSGSLKNANITLEHTRAVIPRMISDVFFDVKYIFFDYSAGGLGIEPRY